MQIKVIDLGSHEIDKLSQSVEDSINIGVKLEKSDEQNDEVCDEIQDGSDDNRMIIQVCLKSCVCNEVKKCTYILSKYP